MATRVTMSLDDEAAARLLELAGSPRKQGEFVSRLIHSVYENRETGGEGIMASETLKLQLTGVVAELNLMRTRLAALEQMRVQ